MEDQIFGGSVGVPKTDCASGRIFGKVSPADLMVLRDKQISGIKRCGTVRILRFGCQNRSSRRAVGRPNFWWSGWCTKNRSYKSGGIFGKVSPADLDMVLRDMQISGIERCG